MIWKYIIIVIIYLLLNVTNIKSYEEYSIEKDLYNILYPNYMNFSDVYMLPLDNKVEKVDNNKGPEPIHLLEMKVLSQLMTSNSTDIVSNDLDKYMTLSTIMNNTRRGGFAIDYGDHDREDPGPMEDEKKQILININLQFIIHTRYIIAKAMKLKEQIRTDKRYRLGYLFNRMRRLKYEQLKVMTSARDQNTSESRRLESALRFYEKVIRFDIDMRDTAAHIKEVFKEKALFDTL